MIDRILERLGQPLRLKPTSHTRTNPTNGEVWTLELLCADDFGAGYKAEKNLTDEDREHLTNYEDTREKHQQLREEAQRLGITCNVADTDDRDSRHSDAYLYFRPSQINDVMRVLKELDLHGDILDVPASTSVGAAEQVGKRTGWTVLLNSKQVYPPAATRSNPGKQKHRDAEGLPEILYHGTQTSLLPSIMQHGLDPSHSRCVQQAVYLTNYKFTAQNYEGMRGGDFTILEIDTSILDPDLLGPDNYELQDLLNDNPPEELEGIDRWSDVSWQDSLRHSSQVVYYGTIPPSAIKVSAPLKTRKNPAKKTPIVWAYHGTAKKLVARIQKEGIVPRTQPRGHADEKRATRDPVAFFSVTHDGAATWGSVVLRFPWPEESYEDPYGDTIMLPDGEITASNWYTYDWIPPGQIEIKRGGRWVPLRHA